MIVIDSQTKLAFFGTFMFILGAVFATIIGGIW